MQKRLKTRKTSLQCSLTALLRFSKFGVCMKYLLLSITLLLVGCFDPNSESVVSNLKIGEFKYSSGSGLFNYKDTLIICDGIETKYDIGNAVLLRYGFVPEFELDSTCDYSKYDSLQCEFYFQNSNFELVSVEKKTVKMFKVGDSNTYRSLIYGDNGWHGLDCIAISNADALHEKVQVHVIHGNNARYFTVNILGYFSDTVIESIPEAVEFNLVM